MTKFPPEIQARSLRYFIALYETSSFIKAAERLCITQPALSNSIRNLEKQLDITLFDRTPQGVEPTPYAIALHQRAKLSHAELSLAIEEIERLKKAVVGTARIGVGPSMLGVVSRFLPKLLRDRTRLNVTVTEGPAEQLTREMQAGALDFVVCTTTQERSHPDLHIEMIAMLPTVPVVRAGHPLTRSEAHWRNLVDYPWIVAESSLEPATNDLLSRLPPQRPQAVISTNSHALMKMMVSSSDFVCFMPKTLLMHGDFTGRLVTVGPKGGIFKRPLVLITRKRSFLPPVSMVLLEELRRSLGELDLD